MHITRRRTGTLAGTALLAACLLPTLSACGSGTPAPRPPADVPKVALQVGAAPLGKALATQATAQNAAAAKAAANQACTTDPADRQNCRNPGQTIDPNGGDIDGDGVFEQHEPVGPGYKDPRAYDGGKTSGETQCDWLRSQGIAC
ncbi:hypothetical protein GLX30_22865 [Streptomyces sp. Tu 2975]|uniref:hypothetical protein n=1 Tax=Streptomyces sp. Tu 2975 TaxID=2676871 RepID=UPI00135969AB|nr:hypothetical protein [Streptomyces sp. Tu 2975]QIP86396.1 hypothetical protein GLX30_22865 [Streptomyces sp. Tu 2975]